MIGTGGPERTRLGRVPRDFCTGLTWAEKDPAVADGGGDNDRARRHYDVDRCAAKLHARVAPRFTASGW
jgi:hypothetical protein